MEPPFTRVALAFDGSAPARVALGCALALAAGGAQLVAFEVVDLAAVIVPGVASSGIDESQLISELEEEGHAALMEVLRAAGEIGVEPICRSLHGRPVAELVGGADALGADLLIAGTHVREGIEHLLMGSTAEGLLRAAHAPVMIVREATKPLSRDVTFGRVLVAVDNSGPSDAAIELAAHVAAACGSALTFCTVVDTRDLYEKATTYGYDAAPLAEAVRADARALVERALHAAGRDRASDGIAVEEGEPASAIVAAAVRCTADAIVMGTHGRRGLERFFVGSVAEHVVRASPVPVIVTRTKRKK